MSSGSNPSPSTSTPPATNRVSTERTIQALTWLRKFLIAQSSYSTANSLTSGLEPSSTSVEAVETIRTFIEKRVKSAESIAAKAEKQATQYSKHTEAWQQSGATQFLSELDPDAVAEATPLCDIAVALELSPYQCLSRILRTAAVGELAEEYLRSVEQVEMKKEHLAEAQAALREACALRGRAVKGIAEAEKVVEKQREQARLYEEKASRMEAKEQEYDSAAGEWREKVRWGGVSETSRHESIVRGGKQLAKEEKRWLGLQEELKRYEDLPPNLTECQQILANVEAEIEAVDGEINSAIRSMGR
eukprot:GFKZ01015375.1.p1 GENE.GFKZ01015375.1~~GFKZ01015375.1.p1  ORF type:complete len:304 (+),score=43.14 GFKZ01015375.1:188-1099(+)